MKELFILDEPDTKGVAWTSHGDVVRKLDRGWRPATRNERIRYELQRPRLAISDVVFIVLAVLLLRLIAEALS